MAKIIKANTAIVALFEKPLTPCSGVTNPNKIKDTIMRNAILSIEKTSKTNNTIVVIRTKNIKMIFQSIL